VLLATAVLWKFIQHVFRGGEAPDVAVETPRARTLFSLSAALWVVAITAGRLTAYSAYVIKSTLGALAVALAVAVAAILITRFLLSRRAAYDSLPSSLAVSLKGK
jgi:membrane protein YdbS with pleckstrin-like domain